MAVRRIRLTLVVVTLVVVIPLLRVTNTIPEMPVMAARTRYRSFSTVRRTAPAKCCGCAPARPYQESFEIVARRFAPIAVCSRASDG